MAKFNIQFKDFSRENSTVGLHVDDAILGTSQQNVLNAVGSLTLGIAQQTTLSVLDRLSSSAPTDPVAQREIKGLVRYTDNATGKNYTFTIPCWDLVNHPPVAGTDIVPLDDAGEVAAFVVTMEANIKSPDGNAVTIQEIQIVGRNT